MSQSSEAGPSRSSSLTPLPSSQEASQEARISAPLSPARGPTLGSRRSKRVVSNPSQSFLPLTHAKAREQKKAKKQKQADEQKRLQEQLASESGSSFKCKGKEKSPDNQGSKTVSPVKGKGKEKPIDDNQGPGPKTRRGRKRKSDQMMDSSSDAHVAHSRPSSVVDPDAPGPSTLPAQRTRRPRTSRESNGSASTRAQRGSSPSTAEDRKIICPSTPERTSLHTGRSSDEDNSILHLRRHSQHEQNPTDEDSISHQPPEGLLDNEPAESMQVDKPVSPSVPMQLTSTPVSTDDKESQGSSENAMADTEVQSHQEIQAATREGEGKEKMVTASRTPSSEHQQAHSDAIDGDKPCQSSQHSPEAIDAYQQPGPSAHLHSEETQSSQPEHELKATQTSGKGPNFQASQPGPHQNPLQRALENEDGPPGGESKLLPPCWPPSQSYKASTQSHSLERSKSQPMRNDFTRADFQISYPSSQPTGKASDQRHLKACDLNTLLPRPTSTSIEHSEEMSKQQNNRPSPERIQDDDPSDAITAGDHDAIPREDHVVTSDADHDSVAGEDHMSQSSTRSREPSANGAIPSSADTIVPSNDAVISSSSASSSISSSPFPCAQQNRKDHDSIEQAVDSLNDIEGRSLRFGLSPITSSASYAPQGASSPVPHDGSQILEEMQAWSDEMSQPSPWEQREGTTALRDEVMVNGAIDDVVRNDVQEDEDDAHAELEAASSQSRDQEQLLHAEREEGSALNGLQNEREEERASSDDATMLLDQTSKSEEHQQGQCVKGSQFQPASPSSSPIIDAHTTAGQSSQAKISASETDTAEVPNKGDAEPAQPEAATETGQPATSRDVSTDMVPAHTGQAEAPTETTPPAESQDLFAAWESLDYADVPLTPVTTKGADTNGETQEILPTAGGPRDDGFGRTFSRVSTTRSEFDLEDDGFWKDVMASESGSPAKDAEPVQAADPRTSLVPAKDADEVFEPLSGSQLDEEASVHSSPPRSPSPVPGPPPPGAFMGFSTGANKRLAGPSAAAMQQAAKRFADVDKGGANTEREIQQMAAAAAKRRAQQQGQKAKVLPESSTPRNHASATQQATASASLNRDSDESDCEPDPSAGAIPATVSFAKANGKSLDLSKAALEKAKRQMNKWEVEVDREIQKSLGAEPSATAGSTKSSDTASTTHRSATPISNSNSPMLPRNALASIPMNSPRMNKAQPDAHQPTPQSKATLSTASASTMTPAPKAMRPQQTPVRQASPTLRSRHSFVRPDQRASRISLGMTPRAKPGPNGPAGGGFKTPFKSSARPSLADTPTRLSSPAIMQASRYPRSSALQGQASLLGPTNAQPQVFNLSAPVERKGLRAFGIKPADERTLASRTQVESCSEAFQILERPILGSDFVFDSNGVTKSPDEALLELQSAGGSLADIRWVRNHWTLIVWKLAAYAAALPDQWRKWFCFDEVLRQLRYRYEREVNLAQRPAIKRIQEHDSSPGVPMILCVFDIPSETSQQGSAGDSIPAGCNLELTDGWYRIGAKVDPPLRRAIKNGKIAKGTKLAVQGCKLDSYGFSACDPISGLSKVSLVLNANSTSIAKWDARLGFTRRSFVSTLRSLTPDGGVVTCMEIVLTRLFPPGYADVGNGGEMSASSQIRDKAAEAEAQQKWEAQREDCQTRLSEKKDQQLRRLDLLQDLLYSYASDSAPMRGDSDSRSDDYDLFAEDLFEDLMNSDRQAAILSAELGKEGGDHLLSKLLETLSRRGEAIRMDAQIELLNELNQLCPPRRVLSFQECRFEDLSSSKASGRTVQLKIRDIDSYPEGLIAEGGRYRVSNLAPVRLGSWRGADEKADVFLTTRRDTKWFPLGS
ncbi:unnamed protein product [Sympodiomycopsis kandeliae]